MMKMILMFLALSLSAFNVYASDNDDRCESATSKVNGLCVSGDRDWRTTLGLDRNHRSARLLAYGSEHDRCYSSCNDQLTACEKSDSACNMEFQECTSRCDSKYM